MGGNALSYTFKYSDGRREVKHFSSIPEAYEFAHNEGDHLVDWWAGDAS